MTRATATATPRHHFTVDVEEYFHPSALEPLIDPASWESLSKESRRRGSDPRGAGREGDPRDVLHRGVARGTRTGDGAPHRGRGPRGGEPLVGPPTHHDPDA